MKKIILITLVFGFNFNAHAENLLEDYHGLSIYDNTERYTYQQHPRNMFQRGDLSNNNIPNININCNCIFGNYFAGPVTTTYTYNTGRQECSFADVVEYFCKMRNKIHEVFERCSFRNCMRN